MFGEWLMFVIKIITVLVFVAVPVLLLVAVKGAAKHRSDKDEEEGSYSVKSLFKEDKERKEFMHSALEHSRFDPDSKEELDAQDKGQEMQDATGSGSGANKSSKSEKEPSEFQTDKAENTQDLQNKEDPKSKSDDESSIKAKAEKRPKKKSRKLLKKERLEKEKQALKERLARIDKARAEGKFCPRDLYVLDYDGNVKATGNDALRKEIDAVLSHADERDEVVLRLTSPGGVVNGYGLAASELARLRERGIHLTVCVDEVAASGGYMMASVAERIVASPFAYIGSIGVVMSVPNFNKVLKKHDVEFEQLTAGKYKRTVTMFGENTDEAKKKCRDELEAVHARFKALVSHYRPKLDLEKVATGEYWLAEDALKLGLVDAIGTSDDYIADRMSLTSRCALSVSWDIPQKTSLLQKVIKLFSAKAFVSAIAEETEKRLNDNQRWWR